jgi:tRNA threonylcarbamoyladenosine biosynthesis protein TsaB
LIEDGKLIAEKAHRRATLTGAGMPLQPRGNHSEIVLPLIQSVLETGCISFADLSGIAVSIGPGSFTGLRIGLATVKGIAYDMNIPVVGVSTLLAHAARVKDFEGAVYALLDARKNEVYAALFERHGGDLKRLSEDCVMAVTSAAEQRHAQKFSGAIAFVGDGAERYRSVLLQRFGATAQFFSDDSLSTSTVAYQVARAASERFCAEDADDLGRLAPRYLRASEAEVKRGKNISNLLK